MKFHRMKWIYYANEIDPNPPEYMKFYRMKWLYNATQSHQEWRASWGEQLRNDDDGTHRVFSVQRDYAVEQFLMDKENYNKTLGTEKDNVLEDQRKEDVKNFELYIEKEQKKKKEKEELEKEEELKTACEIVQPVKQEEEKKVEKKEEKKEEKKKKKNPCCSIC
ncbi:hypothetical protein GCK72_020977 [Caenorhabditis remanei]|uniref:Uncharacterized protein n=1 Tax=Caenorhabditis remanei TaxID=31234 RepID=A0A6A5GIA3_CAERE|nr:hypothetical protein GCK72_020977 [Caenorhabditis remanei]KAF1754416.1 hypothetical protein GCK72_020977 [Caenorhabditis remanei]